MVDCPPIEVSGQIRPLQSTPTGPTVTPGNLQTTVPAPTYAAGSQELAFYTTFNAFRQAEGLGLLAQNSKLDAADRNHLNYLLTNTDLNLSSIDPATGRPQFHIEDPKRPGSRVCKNSTVRPTLSMVVSTSVKTGHTAVAKALPVLSRR